MEMGLDLRTSFVSGSLEWVAGPQTGWMTDGTGDDEGEYLVADELVRVRVGAGANAVRWRRIFLMNDPLGQDGVALHFKSRLTDDCLLLQCDGTPNPAAAYIYGEGDISGNSQFNDGARRLSGCQRLPRGGSDRARGTNRRLPTCSHRAGGYDLSRRQSSRSKCPRFENNPLAQSLANYTWTGPNGFSANTPQPTSPMRHLTMPATCWRVTFTGLECLLQIG